MTGLDYVDLFAGPGGWDVAARQVGLLGYGIENDPVVVETRMAAGLPSLLDDVRHHSARHHQVAGLVASPPCQTFSQAGRGAGHRALAEVLAGAAQLATRQPLAWVPDDERTSLVLEPLRWALDAIDNGTPYEWIALEQVPTVTPVWQAFAAVLRREGYAVDTGHLQAEQYGVPQTRRRAFLVASLHGLAALPEPTHRKYRKGVAQQEALPGQEHLAPWVSMAEALGWGLTKRPSTTVLATSSSGGGPRPLDGGAGTRRLLREAQEAGDWRWPWEAKVNDQTGTPVDLSWPLHRPSTTVSTRNLVQHPGSVANRHQPGVTKSRNDGIWLTAAEGATLQTFPPDYPFQGNRTHQFKQIGNAIPCLLAGAVLACAATATEEHAA